MIKPKIMQIIILYKKQPGKNIVKNYKKSSKYFLTKNL